WRASRSSAARVDRGHGRAVRCARGIGRMNAGLQSLARADWLRRVDAALGEWVARAFPDSPPEVALAAALAARAVDDGHSALRLDAAPAWLASLDGRGEAPVLPDAAAWQKVLAASAAVHVASNPDADEFAQPRPLILDAEGRVYLARYFGYEQRLAENLVARSRSGSLKLVTGGPGTGKTHGVVRLLASGCRSRSQVTHAAHRIGGAHRQSRRATGRKRARTTAGARLARCGGRDDPARCFHVASAARAVAHQRARAVPSQCAAG